MRETYGRIARAERSGRAGAVWVVWAGLVLVLCALLVGACAPSIDPAAKADIDGRLAALREGGTTVPAPPGFDPMPLSVGQWVQYKMIDDKGRPSFLTYKVVSQQAGAFWIETLHETYFGRTAQKMLIAFGSRTDPNQIEVRAVEMLDRRGGVSPVSPATIPVLQVTYRSVVEALAFTWMGMPQESATVPAGRFEGCYRAARRRAVGPLAQPRRFLASPGVPALRAGPQPRRSIARSRWTWSPSGRPARPPTSDHDPSSIDLCDARVGGRARLLLVRQQPAARRVGDERRPPRVEDVDQLDGRNRGDRNRGHRWNRRHRRNGPGRHIWWGGILRRGRRVRVGVRGDQRDLPLRRSGTDLRTFPLLLGIVLLQQRGRPDLLRKLRALTAEVP